MIKYFFLITSLLISQNLFAQKNLVLNPSFEKVDGKLKCYLYDVGKFPIVGWTSASEGSIDAFSMTLLSNCVMYPLNDSFSDQKPRTGSNYLGFSNIYNDAKEYREYVRGTLSEPLEVGSTYKIQFYVCLSAFASAATNNIGLVFIDNKTPIFSNVGPLPIAPDVNYSGKPIAQTEKWTLLTFEFTAEKPNLDAFIIGNFFTSEQTNYKVISEQLPIEAYMLIDDVSITKVDITFDLPKEICYGDHVDFPLVAKNGVSGTWNPKFDPYNSQIYTFKTVDNTKVNYEIKVLSNFAFDLNHYCENYHFIAEVKFIDSSAINFGAYQWKLNDVILSNKSLKINLSDFQNLLQNNNLLEFSIKNSNGCHITKKINFSNTNLCTIQKEVSPNNDGKEDNLDLTVFGGVKLKILNRFGKTVYESDRYFKEWKGESNEGALLPAANYYYQIETNTNQELTGWINLIY